MTVHDAARGFERAADAYDRGRPEYPPEAVARVAAALRLRPGVRLLDAGAGTGKLSRLVAAAGAAVFAADPAEPMIRRLAGAPGIVPLRAVAEALPFRDGAFDAAAAASAFHWFDGPRALRELYRVQRAGGRLALLWNARDDAEPWVARLSEIVNRREGRAPRHRTGAWRAAFDAAPGLFAAIDEAHVRHVHALSPAAALDRVASISFVAAMPDAERGEVLAEVRALLASHPDTAGRAELALPYRTDVHVYERPGGPPR
ncbi:MAG TPA: methyltransferase domain-containing protein [Anaeromyxobacter sp.]|nr:methyltransferase domain-containing protein [Anaeromyxobacter sp.]